MISFSLYLFFSKKFFVALRILFLNMLLQFTEYTTVGYLQLKINALFNKNLNCTKKNSGTQNIIFQFFFIVFGKSDFFFPLLFCNYILKTCIMNEILPRFVYEILCKEIFFNSQFDYIFAIFFIKKMTCRIAQFFLCFATVLS